MYLGEIVELATTSELFGTPLHPYTQGLLASVHKPDPDAVRSKLSIQGEVPSPITPPSGCRFHTRCPHAQPLCRERKPALKQYGTERWASCHLLDTSLSGAQAPSPPPAHSSGETHAPVHGNPGH